MKHVDIYTDGACSGNPGAGGWGAVIVYKGIEKELSGGQAQTTNNRMELTAVIEALKALKEPCSVTLTSDSKYVIDGITKGWAESWRAKGWRKGDGKSALNPELGEELLELGRSRQSVAGGYMYWYDYDQTQPVGVDKWTMLCMDVHSGEVWPLEVDTPNVSLEVLETDGHLAYSCFYSAQSVACWEVVYENDRPAALKLLDDDINS